MLSNKIHSQGELSRIRESYLAERASYDREVLVCSGAGCISSNCGAVLDSLVNALEQNGLVGRVRITATGCMGLCAAGPLLLVEPDGVLYTAMSPEKTAEVVARHLSGNEIAEEYTYFDPASGKYIPHLEEIPFFREQIRVVLRNCGRMEHASLEAYIARDGYSAAAKALSFLSQEDVVQEVTRSGLRGRGGAGFPTGLKWKAGMEAPRGQKYLVCNADEGDPGAFMDRSVLEGDPHSVIEGMLLGGYAIGASQGFVYVRAEYPLAVERLGNAIDQARLAGLLGDKILGSDFSFDIEIRIGAGAFVCGEETALLASIEGHRGEPRQKPPFPFESGLFGRPTIINNVETFANIAPILLKGAAWYSGFGTEKSRGTKVFALAGGITNSGIIEVPMGITLGDIVYKIGGGLIGGRKFKAIQSGGPSGGCLTREHLGIPVDYESLSQLGAIMGSGGLIVMNEDTCMVDTARYFMDFIRDESCGKCLPCRTGTRRMLEILERITEGRGKLGDIETLEELSETLRETAMCGLGQTASNPIVSTLRYFREEYETHILDRHCDAGICAELYTAPCRNACPAAVNVPGYMSLVAAGRLGDAYELIRQENPFPAVCGRVCTHPCESRCRRGQVDEALAICSIKRFVGDWALRDDYSIPVIPSLPSTGKRTAIIGAGPSGLTCAYYLAHLGHGVDVFEADREAGGVLYWGIPEYRLPKRVLAKEIRAIEAAGVRIHTGIRIGTDMSFEDLRGKYDAIYIAVGTQRSIPLNIPGETLDGAESGLHFLRRVGLKTDRSAATHLVVVGGGSTAMDVARTAIRLGASLVTVVYRRGREDMPAGSAEAAEAEAEGIRFETFASPTEILGEGGRVCGLKCRRTGPGLFGKDGRHSTVFLPGSEFVIPCTGVVSAINQEVDDAFTSITEASVTASGSFDTDRFTAQTSQKGIFAGGDASPWGANVVISAIADGKRAARSIDLYLGGSGELNKGSGIQIPFIEDEEVAEHPRFPEKTLPAKDRRGNFLEVNRGFHKLDAMGESLRCLHCDRR